MASKKHNNQELERLLHWCRLLLDYMSRVAPNERAVFAQYREVVEDAAARRNIRGMRGAKGELSNWLRDMGPQHCAQFDAEFQTHTGIDSNVLKEIESTVTAILKRGKIRTDDEYQILNEWMAHALNESDNRSADIELADRLLTSFGTQIH